MSNAVNQYECGKYEVINNLKIQYEVINNLHKKTNIKYQYYLEM